MNLRNLKNLLYKQEIFDAIVTSKKYEPSRRYGIGLGTVAPANWYVTLEDEAGNAYEIATNRLDFFDPQELEEGDKVSVKSTRILGVYFSKVERMKNGRQPS